MPREGLRNFNLKAVEWSLLFLTVGRQQEMRTLIVSKFNLLLRLNQKKGVFLLGGFQK